MPMFVSRAVSWMLDALDTFAAAQTAAAMVEAHRRPSPEVLRRLGIRDQDFNIRL